MESLLWDTGQHPFRKPKILSDKKRLQTSSLEKNVRGSCSSHALLRFTLLCNSHYVHKKGHKKRGAFFILTAKFSSNIRFWCYNTVGLNCVQHTLHLLQIHVQRKTQLNVSKSSLEKQWCRLRLSAINRAWTTLFVLCFRHFLYRLISFFVVFVITLTAETTSTITAAFDDQAFEPRKAMDARQSAHNDGNNLMRGTSHIIEKKSARVE